MKLSKGTGKRIWMSICFLGILLFVTSCTLRTAQKKAIPSPKPASTENSVTGIVVENDGTSQITLRALDSEEVTTFSYDDTSVISDEYGQECEGDHIGIGEILQISYHPNEGKIVNASVPEDVWYYNEVQKFSFDTEQNMLEVVGKKYQYGTLTFCSDGTYQVQPMDFDRQDMLTIRGIGIHVYSIVRTRGHGYVRIVNYSDFLGGMAEFDNGLMVMLQENMLITVPEGTYRLTLLKNRMAATETILVVDGQETIADFSDYKKEVKDIGEVTFYIQPEGADLTINGTSIDYSRPVTLNYGKYKIQVSLAGYSDYVGILNVEQPSKPIHIELEEADAEVSLPTDTPKKSDSSSSSNSSTITRKLDKSHTITVTEPEGVEVYLDNVYKGMSPCTFTKIIGSQTITLSLPGYASKSYSIDILDDNKNVKLTFADLEDSSSSTDSTSTPSPTSSSTSILDD